MKNHQFLQYVYAAFCFDQGCQERHDPFKNQTIEAWSAFRSLDYGYSRMQVINSTHLYWEQVSDDQVSQQYLSCTIASGLNVHRFK